MKNVLAFIAILLSVMATNAALITITADGNIQNLPNNSVQYVFSYDKSLRGYATLNGEPSYLPDLRTGSSIVDYFYTEFTGKLILSNEYTNSSTVMWNVGYDLINSNDSIKACLSGGNGFHSVSITSDLNIDSWKIGTVLTGSEVKLQKDGIIKHVLSDLKITSITRSIPVPEPSMTIFFLLGGLCLLFKSFRSTKTKKL